MKCSTNFLYFHSPKGKHVVRAGESALLSDQVPLMLFDGELSISSSSGKWSSIILATHMNSPEFDPKLQLQTLIKLRKFNDAWELCQIIADNVEWAALGFAAIADLNVVFGIFAKEFS